jgi:hypothetical protein
VIVFPLGLLATAAAFDLIGGLGDAQTTSAAAVHEGADVNAPSSLTSPGTRKSALSQTSADLPKAAGGK